MPMSMPMQMQMELRLQLKLQMQMLWQLQLLNQRVTAAEQFDAPRNRSTDSTETRIRIGTCKFATVNYLYMHESFVVRVRYPDRVLRYSDTN